MDKFKKIFKENKPIIAMIHVSATPGTPGYGGSVKKIIDKALKEAFIYEKAGIKAVMIENMHDVPYLNRTVGHEVSALMSIIAYEIKSKTDLICGIQILAGAGKQALAAAHSAGADFIRNEGFVFSHVADEGIMHSDAGELLRYRKQIGAENILIFTDIKKKHASHAVTSDTDIEETAKAAEFFLSDGLIITGKSTGRQADPEDAAKVKKSVKIPVMAGSGITPDNLVFFSHVDAFIVGSYFKKDGNWKNDIEKSRVENMIKARQKIL